MANSKTYRILILGAGFSRPAGLPLGSELFQYVREYVRSLDLHQNTLERDIVRYKNYVLNTEGKSLTEETLDYEKFLSFLDTEHFLGFDGGEQLTDEGNATQLLVRYTIADVLYRHTPKTPPTLYRSFVRNLNPSDWVLTFNYDTLLENSLDAEGIPYRLFPDRFSEIGGFSNVIDSSRDEVVVLKLHGSINWFDRTQYDKAYQLMLSSSTRYEVKDPVFGRNKVVNTVPLTDGPRSHDDPLTRIHRVHDLDTLLEHTVRQGNSWISCPYILSPSVSKMYYSTGLLGLWYGIKNAGGLNLSICVIGYSLPDHDEYARQALYSIFSNYTCIEPDLELNGIKKRPIRILDYSPNDDSCTEIRSRYRFAEWDRTELNLNGFSDITIEWLFD